MASDPCTAPPGAQACDLAQQNCPPGQACIGCAPGKPGYCVANAQTVFAPGPPPSTLPSCMRAALGRSAAGKQTAADDALMGKLGAPMQTPTCGSAKIVPYCQDPRYYNTVYCACQNNALPFPQCVARGCADQLDTAYLTQTQNAVRTNANAACPAQQICEIVEQISGTGNVVQNKSTANCGGVINNIENILRNQPALAVVLLILIILLASAVASPARRRKRRPPRGPPPAAELPGGLPPLPTLAA